MPQTWDRNAALNELRGSNLPANDLIIKKMWIYHHDLEIQSWRYANAKTEYGKLHAKIVVQMRFEGEKSAEVAGKVAETDEAVAAAHLAYRLAEQMVTADREALRILHAQLDDWRTRRADERAADQFMARTQT